MPNLLRRLKFLPWRSLFLISSLVTLIVIILDFLLALGYIYSPAIRRVLFLLYAPPLSILVYFAVSVGIGALAVYLLELFRPASVNTAILWALVLCLAICLVVKSLLPAIPNVVINMNEMQLIGIVLGVFWKGRPYWR